MSILLFNEASDQAQNETLVHEIKNEYRRIDNNWLHLHYKMLAALVLFVLIAECIMGLVLINTDAVHISAQRYILKFIVVPSGVNVLNLLCGFWIIKSKKISQLTKTYCISLLFVFMATVLFIAHNVFAASYVFFIFAIILTTIYANSMLTTITACLSVLLMIVSELFIPWDADKVSIFESTQRLGEFAIALFILFAIFAVSLTEIHYNRKKNEASMQKEIHRQALEHRLKIDELTGVFSRKALLDAMDEMETNKADNRYVFAIADIDHFKDINDKYGHHIGDYYLVTFADILKKHCKACSVFRYGGDEFCLLFKNITLDEAVALCKGIQQSVKKISIPNHPEIQHTVSFGLAVHATDLSTDELFLRADKALYAAKQTRNTIKTY